MNPISLIESNLYDHISWLHKHNGGMVCLDTDEYLLCDSGIADDTFNKVSRLRLKEQTAKDTLCFFKSHFSSRNLPFTLWVTPSTSSGMLLNALQEASFSEEERETGMVLERTSYRPGHIRSDSEKLEVEAITTNEQLLQFSNSLASLFEPYADTVVDFYTRCALELLKPDSPKKQFFGFVNGSLAGTAELHINNGIAGIHNVGVLPEFKKKGLGTRLTQLCIEWAFEAGINIVVLLASEMGEPVYRKLGFQDAGQFIEFACE